MSKYVAVVKVCNSHTVKIDFDSEDECRNWADRNWGGLDWITLMDDKTGLVVLQKFYPDHSVPDHSVA